MKPLLAPLAASLFCLAAACSDAQPDLSRHPGVIQLSEQFTGAYELVDVNERPVSQTSFAGKITIIYFGFASCPDVCPLALGRLSAALHELDQSTLDNLAPVFITVDPKRDTPDALRAFLSFDARLIGLTGTEDAVDAAKRGFKVYAVEETLQGSTLDYTMNHSSLFYIADRTGAPIVAVKDTVTPTELAAILSDAVALR